MQSVDRVDPTRGKLYYDISEILSLDEQQRMYEKAERMGLPVEELVSQVLYAYLVRRGIYNVSTPVTGIQ